MLGFGVGMSGGVSLVVIVSVAWRLWLVEVARRERRGKDVDENEIDICVL